MKRRRRAARNSRLGEDGAKMYEWFDRVGYSFDRAGLHREFPDVPFHDFESWARRGIGTHFFRAHRTHV